MPSRPSGMHALCAAQFSYWLRDIGLDADSAIANRVACAWTVIDARPGRATADRRLDGCQLSSSTPQKSVFRLHRR